MGIYLDNSATTKLKKEVLDEMIPFLTEVYGNPSSVHSIGKEAKNSLEESRDKISKLLGVKSKEIFFTSGGSEADNWALKGVSEAKKDKGKHIITSSIEHKAINSTCQYLEKLGYEISYIDVDKYGVINLDSLKKAIREDTILVSIMYANNEIGTIEPIEEVGNILKSKGILFHVDAVQALPTIDIDVNKSNIDLMSLSAHKIGGPKGIGLLYIRENTKINSFIHGGDQERKKRAGTENLANIVGFSKAFELLKSKKNKVNYIRNLRDKLENDLLKLKGVHLNGHPEKRLVGNLNISIENIDSQVLLMLLDQKGVYVSSGSACTAGSLNPSHVLKAIGRNDDLARNCIRISINEENNLDEILQASDIIKETINRLRS
ncbi:MAG: cysteine desulfurase family protein [Peptoniphilaceae bacterium]